MNAALLKQPSALVPIAMSLAAMVTLVAHIAIFGTARQPDEGAAAHLWQILMAGQVPIVAFYAVKWLPRAPKRTLLVLAAQAGAALAAMAPVYFLGW